MVPIILLILTLLSAAVSCLALAPRILSTTNTSVNTVVNVSCPDDQWLTTGKMTTVSTCDASGHCTPDVPGCIGTALSIIILWRFCSLPIQHTSFIQAISIGPLQVQFYLLALSTTARILYLSFTPQRNISNLLTFLGSATL